LIHLQLFELELVHGSATLYRSPGHLHG
jgi:hypothetical protein